MATVAACRCRCDCCFHLQCCRLLLIAEGVMMTGSWQKWAQAPCWR